MGLGRDALIADTSVSGVGLCVAYTQRADGWLRELFAAAAGETPGLALVALGGYGRSELCPHSDLDVLLLHDGRPGIGAIADAIWYPVWDEGVKLGHAVRTLKETLALAGGDLDSATALLPARHLAGDPSLTSELHARAMALWQKRSKRWLPELAERVRERHAKFGEVAFLLEPELKEGRGGLRDVHALGWAQSARPVLWRGDDHVIADAHHRVLEARAELHRRTGRPTDRLVLQEQDAVAASLGIESADVLMRRISEAARVISWRSDETWTRITEELGGRRARFGNRDRSLGGGLVLRNGEVHLDADAPVTDAAFALRAAAVAAGHRTGLARAALDQLKVTVPALPDPWPDEARLALVELLGAGAAAIPVIEALDQNGLFVRVLPEWETVRSKPQRNAYHTFTVDRHLCEAAAQAAKLADRVARPDLLLVGTLLHDIGKGYPGDHTEVGVVMVRDIGRRMGFPPEDVDQLVAMCEHHLLLPDVATRRDLDDNATIAAVAAAVVSPLTLELLAALTEADSIATGPSAWGSWKADLVDRLVERTAHVLAGGLIDDVTDDFPGPFQLMLARKPGPTITGHEDMLTVVVDDQPGLFSAVAGACALHGIDILDAQAATVDGRAIEVLRVKSNLAAQIRWDRVVEDVEAAIGGRLALAARLAERAAAYRRDVPLAQAIVPQIDFLHDVSEDATVVEVRAADAIGVLYRITSAMNELRVSIVSAKVLTLGPEVIDTFYIVDRDGQKVTDPDLCRELERAVLHALSRD